MVERTVPTIQEETAAPVTKETTRSNEYYTTPPVDIYEQKDELVLVADLPGCEKESVKVDVENGILTLQAKTKSEVPGTSMYREFDMVNFYRQFELSEAVNVGKISAELTNGVLLLHLPKVEKAKPRQIDVRVTN